MWPMIHPRQINLLRLTDAAQSAQPQPQMLQIEREREREMISTNDCISVTRCNDNESPVKRTNFCFTELLKHIFLDKTNK